MKKGRLSSYIRHYTRGEAEDQDTVSLQPSIVPLFMCDNEQLPICINNNLQLTPWVVDTSMLRPETEFQWHIVLILLLLCIFFDPALPLFPMT